MGDNSRFRGTGVALITPFKEDGAINFDALERVIEHVVQKNGVDYIVSLGTTGEAIPLSAAECRSVLDFSVKTVNKRVPLVAGFFGGNNTLSLVEKLKTYDFTGFDAIMSSSPAYNKPTQEGIYQHYMKIAEASPLPIIIYNVPSRTSSNVEGETIIKLAKSSSKFLAVKEASGNVAQVMHIIKYKPENFLVLSGDDPITLPLIAAGADGVISVIANAYPVAFSSMTRAALNNDFETARKLNNQLLDLHKWLYVDGNPGGIKATMEILGICESHLRLPLVKVGESTYQRLKQEIAKIGE